MQQSLHFVVIGPAVIYDLKLMQCFEVFSFTSTSYELIAFLPYLFTFPQLIRTIMYHFWTSKVILDYYSTGWFARDPAILSRVGRILLQHPDNGLARPSKIIIAEDCFKLLSFPSGRITNVLVEAVKQIYGGKMIFNSPHFNLSMHHFRIMVNSDRISVY